ncbi:hypothetical protein [Actibacterium sp.]|uniref:hypothetical protein n=1 Tax=Actibacterium sp. TaxID=1872125 RepID=UPI00257B2843|nr:hypothetical protein [Actibacterium sp.]
MRAILPLLALLMWATDIPAGAWLRDEGEVFLSFSQTAAIDGDGDYASVLLEYGLRPALTLGLDAGQNEEADRQGVLFLRHRLDRAEGPNRLAAELGLGTSEGALTFRPGLSWGRGVATRWGQGWVSVDTLAELRESSTTPVLKADTTFGLRTAGDALLIVQLQAGDYPDATPYLRVVPSYVHRMNRRTFVEFGLSAGAVGHDPLAVKLGTWLAF